MGLFRPHRYYRDIYSIDYAKLKKEGITCLIFDLDNTLVSYRDKLPTKKVKDLFTKLKKMGFKVIIFSNSGSKRLKPFKEQLDVDVCSRCFKPSPNKFLYVINEYKLEVSQIAIIGDQFYTDIIGGNRVGITTILINPASKTDMILTYIQRFREKKLIKKLSKADLFYKGKYYG